MDPGRHARWLSACLSPNGIRISPDDPATTPATQYWGVQAFRLTGTEPDRRTVAGAIERHAHPDGGFGRPVPTLWHSYCAVRVLHLLGEWSTP